MQGINWWGAATNLQEGTKYAWSIAQIEFHKNINLFNLEEPYRGVIMRILKEG
jgi:hypothetical protein